MSLKLLNHPGLRMFAVYLIIFNQMLDTSVANLALSNIASDLFIDVYHAAWIVTSFGTGVAISLPFGSMWTKRSSPELVLCVGCAIFIFSSIGCGLATEPWTFILCRLLQGMGSGISIISAFPIMIAISGQNGMSFAVALCTSAISLAPVLGPIIGAFVTIHFGWRWLFMMNVPITSLSMFILLKGFTFPPGNAKEDMRPRLMSLAMFGICVASLQFILDFGEQNRWFRSPVILFSGAVALAAGVAFFLSNRHARSRIFNFSIFGNTSYTTTTLVLAIGNGIIFSSLVFLPLWLRTDRHMPMLNAGVIVSLGSAVAAVATPLVGKYFPRKYFPGAAIVSLALTAISFFMMSRFSIDTPTSYLIASRLVAGCGLAIFSTPLITMSLAKLSSSDALDGNSISTVLRVTMSNVMVAVSFMQYQRLSDGAQNRFQANADSLSFLHGPDISDSVASHLTGLFHTMAMSQIFFVTGIFFLVGVAALIPIASKMK